MIRSINQVLKTLSTAIKQKPSNFSIVSGNQSGDLDSIVSAISYAYFNHVYNDSKIIVPLLNFTRKELSSRKDVLLVFKQHDIDTKNIFFTDDLTELKSASELILVDHNTVQGKVKDLGIKVVGIVDHHEDEGISTDANPRIIQKAGSCSSLVFKYWYDLIDDKSLFNGEIVKFLLAPLVIDTGNLTSRVEKVDTDVFKIYENYLDDVDTGAFYKDVRAAKDDIEGLSLEDIFLKDYKYFEFEVGSGDVVKKVGISSVVKPLAWLKDSFPDLSSLSHKYLEDSGLDVFIIMTSFLDKEDKFKREIAVLASDESNELLLQLSVDSVKEYLELEPQPQLSSDSPKFQAYIQKNLAASRKQVAPSFKRALERL